LPNILNSKNFPNLTNSSLQNVEVVLFMPDQSIKQAKIRQKRYKVGVDEKGMTPH